MKTILNNPDRIKRDISRFYTGFCKIDIKESITDPESHKTRAEVQTLYEGIPCRLSHDSKTPSSAYERNTVPQTTMLFLDNELDIPAGCRITVTQDNITNEYGCASEPNVFETHQQIELTLWEDWSGQRSKRFSQDV